MRNVHILLAMLLASPASGLAPQASRRDIVKAAFGGAAAFAFVAPSQALDMDAFVNSQVRTNRYSTVAWSAVVRT